MNQDNFFSKFTIFYRKIIGFVDDIYDLHLLNKRSKCYSQGIIEMHLFCLTNWLNFFHSGNFVC